VAVPEIVRGSARAQAIVLLAQLLEKDTDKRLADDVTACVDALIEAARETVLYPPSVGARELSEADAYHEATAAFDRKRAHLPEQDRELKDGA